MVKGNPYNGNMPAFGPGGGYNWNDAKIAQVLTFIRQEWGNAAPAITPEKVAEIRKAESARAKPWSDAELAPYEKR
jgi:mono/diheme cytochrome c family protein